MLNLLTKVSFGKIKYYQMIFYASHFPYSTHIFPSLNSADIQHTLGAENFGTTITFDHYDINDTSLIIWKDVRDGCADLL